MPHNSHGKAKNHLANSNSPYLLQHAENPVNWYPWGDEAFNLAENNNRLIFLSIGYSTCHWCHVMAHESFESDSVAEVLNENFVSIKVDREERPDVDKVYMDVCQAMTGGGGWPLTVIMTPSGIPIFAGTYFPRESKHGRPGLIDLLKLFSQKWRETPGILVAQAEKIRSHFQNLETPESEKLSDSILKEAVSSILAEYEPRFGGFGSSPKFPMAHKLTFLLRMLKFSKGKSDLEKVEFTLKSMYKGGIYDHIGFGFCRYSVDEKWLVPHFEKMLYDNALLAQAYLEAYQTTKDEFYKQVVQEIFIYLQRDLMHESGAYYCAEDADSEGEEGKFYIFSKGAFSEALDEGYSDEIADYFGVTLAGNFEYGQNILNLRKISSEFANEKGLSQQELEQKIGSARKLLLDYRSQRVRPSLDDKILTSWNGLIISALANAGKVFNDQKLIKQASKAADFILDKMTDDEGRLLRSWRKGTAGGRGYLEDYTFFVTGLVDLFMAGGQPKYLASAIKLHNDALTLFAGNRPGEFFETASDAEKLFVRPENEYDGAIPSAISHLAMNAVTIARLTANPEHEKIAEEILEKNAQFIKRVPSSFTRLLTALQLLKSDPVEIILVGEESSLAPFKAALSETYLPDAIQIIKTPQNAEELSKLIPMLKDYQIATESPTLYICNGYSCQSPITDPNKIKESLQK